jgi:hypothetical protein
MGFEFLLANSEWAVMLAVYVQSFLHVSVANVGYLVFFVVFATKPQLRRRYWGLLVWYCIAVLLLLYIWKAVVLRAIAFDSLPTFVVGLDTSISTWAWNIIPGYVSVLPPPSVCLCGSCTCSPLVLVGSVCVCLRVTPLPVLAGMWCFCWDPCKPRNSTGWARAPSPLLMCFSTRMAHICGPCGHCGTGLEPST